MTSVVPLRSGSPLAVIPTSTNWETLTLPNLETRIRAAQKAIVERAIALYEINARKLYKERGYSRFADYCQDQWGFTRAQGYRLVGAGEKAKQASLTGDIMGDFSDSAFFEIAAAEDGDQVNRALNLLGTSGGRKADMEQAIAVSANLGDDDVTEWNERVRQVAGGSRDRQKLVRQRALEIARDRSGGRYAEDLTVEDADLAAEELEAEGWTLPKQKKAAQRRILDQYFSDDSRTQPIQRLGIYLDGVATGTLIECCDGKGDLSKYMQDWEGVDRVLTNDINTQRSTDFHLDAASGELWRHLEQQGIQADWVITNPPYDDQAARVVRHALSHARKGVAMLLRLSFQEFCEDRHDLCQDWSDRLSIIYTHKRTSFSGDGKTDSVATAWFVWGKDGRVCDRPFVYPRPN